MQISLLNDIVIIFILSLAVIYLFSKIHLPPIIGYLLTGVISGPYGFGLVKSVHDVEILAEVGILLLLFTIGIEFSFQEILRLKKPVFMGGGIQVAGTIAVVFIASAFFGYSFNTAIFFGFLAALSSTAIVLKIFAEKGMINAPHGRSALSILIFQDIIVVLMILFIPMLGGGGETNFMTELLWLFLKALGIILLVFAAAKYIVPFIFLRITRTRSRELFLISIFVLCFGIVWLTSFAGLSLALGAFLAGLIISESEYSHQALGNILPFRDVFTSFFFVSIGMLLDTAFLMDNLATVLLLSLALIALKSLIAAGATLAFGYPLRTAIIAGLALGQIGEFSFVLARSGDEYGLFSGSVYQLFLSVSIVTMAVTPFLIMGGPPVAAFISRRFGSKTSEDPGFEGLADHMVIIGYGLTGRNLAGAAASAGIDHVIIEMNPDTVRDARVRGEPVFYGDAMNPGILDHASVKKARIIVIAINDPAASEIIVRLSKKMNPGLYVIARTRFLSETPRLLTLGADEVIPEEFETSLEILARALHRYMVPENEIDNFTYNIRAENYKALRSKVKDGRALEALRMHVPELEVHSFIAEKGCGVVNVTLGEADFRNRFNATLAAVQREDKTFTNPGAGFRIEEGDILILITRHENLAELKDIFNA